jgi:hypothetical protein
MMLRLRINPELASQQTTRFVTTDGTPVVLTLRWNERSQFWFIDVQQTLPDGSTTSFFGAKLTPSYPALMGVKSLFSFPGDFILLPTQSTTVNAPVGYSDLGVTWFPCWITEAESIAWRSARGLR